MEPSSNVILSGVEGSLRRWVGILRVDAQP
jgi:hypothetical protein